MTPRRVWMTPRKKTISKEGRVLEVRETMRDMKEKKRAERVM